MKKFQYAALAVFVVIVAGLAVAVRIPVADEKGARLGLTVTLVTLTVIFVVGFLIDLIDKNFDR